MANFWDLPKPVREKIYRMHLVHDGPIAREKHLRIVKYTWDRRSYQRHFMPLLLCVSKKFDKEAAAIYYGENHFVFEPVNEAWLFANITFPRHLRLIRKVTCAWQGTESREGFLAIARMKGLQELLIRVNEGLMVRQAIGSRHIRQSYIPDEDLTPQHQLALIRHPGMSAVLSLSAIPHVQFMKAVSWDKSEIGGSIPGGFLETYVLPRIMGSNHNITRIGLDDDCFPFLSLPPEIRNRIYFLLLRVPGKIHPSTGSPSSTPRKAPNRRFTLPTPESALSLLAVNKQIYNEAFGIFYHCNALEFYYPTQLHAFLLSLGTERQSYLRDLTMHYYNIKVGGIDLAELTFPILKQLPGLRRLQIVLVDYGLRKTIRSNYFLGSSGWNLNKANPLLFPGIKTLFSLRGLTGIGIRFPHLETEFEEAKKDKEYPNFAAKSKKACVVKLTNALEHLNQALTDAQTGKVNKKLLEDSEWHLHDVFPVMDYDQDANV